MLNKNNHRVTFDLPEKDYKLLDKEQNNEGGIGVSAVLRRIIKDWIDARVKWEKL